MSNTEKTFAKGIIFKKRENQPDWVIGQLSFKLEEALQFLKENDKNGWVNLDIKKSQNDKFYVELNTFEAKPQEPKSSAEIIHPDVSKQPNPFEDDPFANNSVGNNEDDSLPF